MSLRLAAVFENGRLPVPIGSVKDGVALPGVAEGSYVDMMRR